MNYLENIDKRYQNDLYLTFFTKKVEKIVSALYLITEHLNDLEPLKWSIRKKATSLLSEVMKLNDFSISDKLKISVNVSSKLFEILFLLELTMVSKLISEENLEVFKREFDLLLSLIKNNFDKINDQFSPYIGGEYFKLKDKSLRPKEIKDVLESIKDKNRDKRHFLNKEKSLLETKDTKINKISNNERKNNRRDRIKEILSKGQKLTIKDISNMINDCSEKTIQRELQKMMKDGLLKKEGERRWSRYFIKT